MHPKDGYGVKYKKLGVALSLVQDAAGKFDQLNA